MDIDLILESIFGEYKRQSIALGRDRAKVEERLENIRKEFEGNIRSSLDDFVGMPNNETTIELIRRNLNDNINQFLDTNITLDDIQMDRDTITIQMGIAPKHPAQVNLNKRIYE
ncbi:MAG TPA: hypothetical protein VI911_10930 [Patescibacteria group bacterium]|nr:hypothetical protein [Patescibacteria group bacterium]